MSISCPELTCVALSDWDQMYVYLLANGVRCQLVVMHHEPHQTGCIGKSWVGHSCDGIVLEVHVFHVGGDGWHSCQAPPITVHGDREGGGAVTLIWTCPSCGVCLQGAIIVSLALPTVQPGKGVPSMGEREWKQGRQEEDNHHTHGHSHTNLHCNLAETKTERQGHDGQTGNKEIHKQNISWKGLYWLILKENHINMEQSKLIVKMWSCADPLCPRRICRSK